MRVVLGVFLLCALTSAIAKADTVILKNGDKLTGTFVEVQDKKLAFKSDALGDISIPLDKVQSFSAEKQAVIVGTDRKIVRGQIELQPSGDWQVTADGASQTVAAAVVKAILPADTYHTLVEVPAKPWQEWKGSANFGYSIQRGDQQATALSTIVAATRERSVDLLFVPHWRTNYGLNMLFAKAEQDGTQITSNAITTDLREDYLLSPQNFVFVLGQLDHIDPQGLYLRQTYGGGYGRDLIHNERILFSALAGVDYIHEKFIAGPSDQSVQISTGEKLGVQLTKRFRFDHYLNFYPNLRHAGRYHFDASANFSVKINNKLAANAGVLDQFLTNPAPGSHENNIAVTTGLGYTF